MTNDKVKAKSRSGRRKECRGSWQNVKEGLGFAQGYSRSEEGSGCHLTIYRGCSTVHS